MGNSSSKKLRRKNSKVEVTPEFERSGPRFIAESNPSALTSSSPAHIRQTTPTTTTVQVDSESNKNNNNNNIKIEVSSVTPPTQSTPTITSTPTILVVSDNSSSDAPTNNINNIQLNQSAPMIIVEDDCGSRSTTECTINNNNNLLMPGGHTSLSQSLQTPKSGSTLGASLEPGIMNRKMTFTRKRSTKVIQLNEHLSKSAGDLPTVSADERPRASTTKSSSSNPVDISRKRSYTNGPRRKATISNINFKEKDIVLDDVPDKNIVDQGQRKGKLTRSLTNIGQTITREVGNVFHASGQYGSSYFI
ncbi:hypothetical protein SAMD00019534_053700, partial [Acytostelium subglobosum LB1]|uniref:hypothetical protein n=1 Tax=Acytostelium subglobosum LB1 TaxID=1410327 RepID=UPI0006448E3F